MGYHCVGGAADPVLECLTVVQLLLFTNCYGKEQEEGVNLTPQQIVELAGEHQMGAGWSVTLVSNDGEEVRVPVDVLSSASAIWRERLQLVGSLDPSQQSEENCTGEEIKAFVEVISARSNDAKAPATELPIKTLLQSLPLVHKYDCKGTKLMLDELDAVHFPDAGVVTRRGLLNPGTAWLVEEGLAFEKTAPWLTQTHLDYLTLKQELYGPEAVLSGWMQKLLAKLLTASPVYDGLKLSENDTALEYDSVSDSSLGANDLIVHLQKQDSAMEIGENEKAPNTPGLVLQVWRLSAKSFSSLIPLLKTNF